MSTRIHIVVSDEFLALIDEARGEVSRSAWVRGAIDRRMAARWAGDVEMRRTVEQALGSSGRAGVRGRVPALPPAEQPRVVEDSLDAPIGSTGIERAMSGPPSLGRVRSSAEARPFRPAPKGKK